MWKTRARVVHQLASGVAAVAAVSTLAACGSDSDEQPTSTPPSAAASAADSAPASTPASDAAASSTSAATSRAAVPSSSAASSSEASSSRSSSSARPSAGADERDAKADKRESDRGDRGDRDGRNDREDRGERGDRDADEVRDSASGRKLDPKVAEVYEQFKTLAPRSLFEQFDSCAPNGVPNSAACSGPAVGQFQFFTSDNKAASTTQLLTELRTSRVVEDNGNKVVGWSTLGTTCIVTVVDNQRGLVLQQMVSAESEDPREVIERLGLASTD